LNRGPATRLRLERRCARAPADLGVRAARWPRLALPYAPRPEAVGILRAARMPRTAPHRLGAHRGPPVRRRRLAVRAPVEAGYHGCISAVTLPSPRPSRPYKCHAFFPPHVGIAAPPRHPRRRRRAPPHPASHGRATAHAPFLDPIGPSRAACCPHRALVAARAEPPRPPPPVIVVHPRRRIPRPNSGHPEALGERMVVPHRFPDREHGRLAGIRSVLPPPHAQGPDCKGTNLSGVFFINQGHGCEVLVLCMNRSIYC
jgi:hypothetical protein